MKNGSCPNVDFTFSERFLPPVYISVFVVGLIVNGWGVKSLLRNWKNLKIINVFVLNIGLADILYLLTLPALVAYFMSGRKWTLGDALCKATRFCFNLNLYGSIGFLTCISVCRYLAIVHPVRVMGRFTPTHSVAVSVAVWLLVSVQSLPDMLYVKTSGNATGKCYDTTSRAFVEDYLSYSLGWTLCGFGVPLLVALGCYGHVAVVLSRSNATSKVTKQRSLKLLYILTLLFSVCYIPYHVFKNLNLAARVWLKRGVCRGWFNVVYVGFQVCRGLVCLNSVLNPLVYLHGNDDVPAPLKRLFRRGRRVFGRPTSDTGSVPMTEI